MSNCENCNEKIEACGVNDAQSEKKMPETIPYIAHEAAMDRAERHTKRWMIAFFVALAMLFVTNIGWIIYESQFETISYTQDGEGLNNVNVGEQGDINYGADSQTETETEQQN